MVVQNIERDILMNVKAGSEVERKRTEYVQKLSPTDAYNLMLILNARPLSRAGKQKREIKRIIINSLEDTETRVQIECQIQRIFRLL